MARRRQAWFDGQPDLNLACAEVIAALPDCVAATLEDAS